jgi:hypothetical protein
VTTTGSLDAILDECLAMMQAGVSIDDCVAPYPEHADELRQLLGLASRMREPRQPQSVDGAAQAQARAALLAATAAERAAPAAEPTLLPIGILRGLFGGFRRLALIPQALPAVLALLILGGGALAAAAVTGDGGVPFPVINRSSETRAELRGTLTSVDKAASVLVIATASGEQRVAVTADTEYEDGQKRPLTLDDFRPGDEVKVSALQRDGQLVARGVELEGRPQPTASPTSPPPPPTAPPVADDDGFDDDNSGPGRRGDDDAFDDDGPGNGNDDNGFDDDNSGPGDGNDDNDGPGRGDDRGNSDDNPGRGQGSGGDDDDDDEGGGDD